MLIPENNTEFELSLGTRLWAPTRNFHAWGTLEPVLSDHPKSACPSVALMVSRRATRQSAWLRGGLLAAALLAAWLLLQNGTPAASWIAVNAPEVPAGGAGAAGKVLRPRTSAPPCEQAHSLHQVLAAQRLVQPSAAALVDAVASGVEGATWLQIGANTMDAALNGNDPLMGLLERIPTWRKLFVEPIPPLYQKLESNVRRWPNATAINLAISPDPTITEDAVPMYCLKEGFETDRLGKDLPHWADQIW